MLLARNGGKKIKKGIIALFTSHFAILFSISLIFTVLPISLLTYENTSNFIVGLNHAVPYFSQLTTIFLFGSILDKGKDNWKRYQLLIFIGYSAITIQYVLFYLMNIHAPNAVLFLVIKLVCNLFGVAHVPVNRKFVSIISRSTKQGQSLGFLFIIETGSFAVGTFAGGFLFDQYGIGTVFLIASISSIFGISFLLVTRPFRIIKNINIVEEEIDKVTNQSKSENHAKSNPALGLKSILIFLVILNISLFMFYPFNSPYMVSIGANATQIGLSLGISCIIGMFVYVWMGKAIDKKGSAIFALFYGSVGYMIVYIIYFFSSNILLLLIAWSMPFFPYFLGANHVITQVTPIKYRGRGFSLSSLFQLIGLCSGAVLGAILSIFLTMKDLILLGIIGFILTSVYLTIAIILQKRKKNFHQGAVQEY